MEFPTKWLKRLFIGGLGHLLSAPLISEIERVIRSKKFGLSGDEAVILTEPFFERSTIVVPTSTINAIPRCPGDNRVLECAVDGGAQYIVTGDRKDLLSHGTPVCVNSICILN